MNRYFLTDFFVRSIRQSHLDIWCWFDFYLEKEWEKHMRDWERAIVKTSWYRFSVTRLVSIPNIDSFGEIVHNMFNVKKIISVLICLYCIHKLITTMLPHIKNIHVMSQVLFFWLKFFNKNGVFFDKM